MFDDGMHHQDQLFHQFISSSSSSPPPSSRPPPPPPSSLHQHHLQQISSTPPFPNLDNPSSSFPIPPPQQPTSSHHQSIQFHDLFHRPNLPRFPHLNQSPSSLPHLIIPSDQLGNGKSDLLVHHNKDDVGLIRSLLPPASTNNLVEREERSTSSSSHHHSRLLRAVVDDDNDTIWSNEEMVALLSIRSSSESSWFPPDFTWEHVSRKLAEIGFKRSSEKCKEKFEEESRTYFNRAFNINTYNGDNKINNDSYKVFGELEELCRDDDNNGSNNTDDQEADEDPINNRQQKDIEVEEAITIRCEKSEAPNNNVFEDITAANEIEDDENFPSPIYSQSADHQLRQSDPVQVDLNAKKRVRKQINREHKKFKIMCEGFVKKMMRHQEELHNKIVEDLLKRDEASVAREEGWKKMEMERLDTEIEVRAQELAIAGARQAALIDVLNKLSTTASETTSQNQNQCNIIDENIVADILKVLPNKPSSHMSKVIFQAHVENDQVFVGSQNPSEQTPACPKSQTSLHETQEPSTIQPNNIVITKMASTSNPPSMLPTSNTAFGDTINNPTPSTKKATLEIQDQISAMISNSRPVIISEDYGKRWPRDEVLALINLRCSFMTNNNNNNNNDGGDEDQRDNNYNNGSANKAPLWERISQKMSELGYKRSGKRCKEKWENINKYFRKTKDNVNKKRSHDSRTCPYFHQLSHLYKYKQGTLLTPPPDNSLLVDGATNTTYSITDEGGAEHVHL